MIHLVELALGLWQKTSLLNDLKRTTFFADVLSKRICKNRGFSNSCDRSVGRRNSREYRHPLNGKYRFFSPSGL